jgi:uroporphyrinogen-III synthase
MVSQPLTGIGVLVTRPREQAGHLAELIEQAGGRPVLFPTLEIQPVAETSALIGLIDRLEEFDWAIFISPTAVEKAMNLIRTRRSLPSALKVAAVGKGSARALRQFGVRDILMPTHGADSGALLEEPPLRDVAKQKIVIFRGEGGREQLAKTLSARGADVFYGECYRRSRPSADVTPLLQQWARGEIHAVTLTSSEALHNLFDLLGKLGQQWLKTTPVFALHERIGAAARELGIAQVQVAGPDDEALVTSLNRWFETGKHHEQ